MKELSSRQMKKFLLELMIRLLCSMTHQSAEHCWVTTTNVMNQFFFFDESTFLSLATRVFFLEKTNLISLFFLFITNSFSLNASYKLLIE